MYSSKLERRPKVTIMSKDTVLLEFTFSIYQTDLYIPPQPCKPGLSELHTRMKWGIQLSVSQSSARMRPSTRVAMKVYHHFQPMK
jgi:hypothetical protein